MIALSNHDRHGNRLDQLLRAALNAGITDRQAVDSSTFPELHAGLSDLLQCTGQHRLGAVLWLLYHGERYINYMERVAGLLPLPWKNISNSEACQLASGNGFVN